MDERRRADRARRPDPRRSQRRSDPRRPDPRSRKKRSAASLDRSMNYTMYITGIIIVSLILSYFIMSITNDRYGFVKPYGEVEVEIPIDASTSEIAKILKDNKVIKYPHLLSMYIKSKDVDDKLNSGTFIFNTNMTYGEVVLVLRKPSEGANAIRVTIPEGYELNQIIDTLVENGICTTESLEDTVNDYPFKHEFLKEVPQRENRLEGYLFPDTYDFYKSDSSITVINKMLNNFDKKFTDEYKEKAEKLDMTMDEVIILASIIEREAGNDEDRGKISAVFHNRLKSSKYPYLQSCATVQYVLKERKPVLSEEDTQIDSPYNTYKNEGLPPGPIASPGLASIEAALNPDKVSYLFFVADPDTGESLFAKTFAQHQRNIDKVGLK